MRIQAQAKGQAELPVNHCRKPVCYVGYVLYAQSDMHLSMFNGVLLLQRNAAVSNTT